jgi:integrase
MAFALEMERAEKLAKTDELTESQARRIFDGVLERTTGERLRCPPIGEYLKQWLKDKEGDKAAGTFLRYSKSISVFLDHLGERVKKPLTSLTAQQIQSFVTARSKTGLSSSTVTVDTKVIRTALNRARRQGLIPTNPAEAVDLPGNDAVERAPFTAAEVKLLVDAATGEWKTLILLAYYTGARLSDCCAMEWGSLDLAKGVLTYTQSKTGKGVAVPLHADLRAHLEGLAGVDSAPKHIMPGMAGKNVGGRHGLSETFRGIMRKAGVDAQRVEREEGVRTLSRRTFHALRHSFTSALANAGVPPELRMKLTGHKTEAVHKGYSHHEIETLRGAIEKMPSL